MHLFELSAFENQEAHSEEDFRFEKSLKELKDLRSQLHYAADYCETTFLKVKEKKDVLENTKEYICRALVTVVDHLGSVSSKLEHRISDTHDFAEAELRISALKQRLLSYELYAHKLALNKVKWTAALPSYHRRYLSAITDVAKSNEDSSAAKVTFKQGFDIEEVPLFMYTYSDKLSPVKIPPSKTAMESCDSDTPVVLPVRDGVSNSILSKGPNPTFHFQLGSPKLGRKSFQRKTLQSAEIMSLIRRIKRTP
ncbi:probable protein ABIL5 isoform X2 [Mangifera indica]|uniref:probable protein ABIL5 isoform X2 n=1 Tax=Mangifera indica TaxID=29780 RepID=UPI001CFBD015|nr:probable protein ABIL5 isoform X2 [Mangifera indica]